VVFDSGFLHAVETNSDDNEDSDGRVSIAFHLMTVHGTCCGIAVLSHARIHLELHPGLPRLV
jgi:hypothetical protein